LAGESDDDTFKRDVASAYEALAEAWLGMSTTASTLEPGREVNAMEGHSR
jgi:hypothetical protein